MIPEDSHISLGENGDVFITYPAHLFPTLRLRPNGVVRFAILNEDAPEHLAAEAREFVARWRAIMAATQGSDGTKW
jgi:hypothetical protein